MPGVPVMREDNISSEDPRLCVREGAPERHCNPASRRLPGLIWDGTARYRASGALSGVERTGKDNGAAIYWVTLKLYTVRAPAFRYFVCPVAAHACANTLSLVRVRLKLTG